MFKNEQWYHKRQFFMACIVLMITMSIGTSQLEVSALENRQDILVHVSYSRPLPEDGLQLAVTLLDDAHDIFAQITALQEESKPALEPVLKRYMYAAEMLGRLPAADAEKRAQFHQQFSEAETQINRILAGYRQQIYDILDNAALMSTACSSLTEACSLSGVASGKYRVSAELSFSSTTLRWFEPVEVKGGEAISVSLTRDNLKNPYWTDLNWWSFMNLDFSKHH